MGLIGLTGDGGIRGIRNKQFAGDFEIPRFIQCQAHGVNLICKG